MSPLAALLLMFFWSFAAATLLPFSSEVVLASLLWQSTAPVLWLFVAASLGNILGSAVNWLLGRYALDLTSRYTDVSKHPRFKKASLLYTKFGTWSLLLSWVPVIGDPLTVLAGFFKMPFLTFLLLVSIAKAGRYAVIIWLFE